MIPYTCDEKGHVFGWPSTNAEVVPPAGTSCLCGRFKMEKDGSGDIVPMPLVESVVRMSMNDDGHVEWRRLP